MKIYLVVLAIYTFKRNISYDFTAVDFSHTDLSYTVKSI